MNGNSNKRTSVPVLPKINQANKSQVSFTGDMSTTSYENLDKAYRSQSMILEEVIQKTRQIDSQIDSVLRNHSFEIPLDSNLDEQLE
jgi:hypothetical protein